MSRQEAAIRWTTVTSRRRQHVLYVFSDNDLSTELPTKIYAFAVDERAAGIERHPPVVLLPILWPWELLRHLR